MSVAIFLAAAVAGQPITVSRGGDDGLTIRFTEAFERRVRGLRSSRPLGVIVDQISPISRSKSRVIIRFKDNQAARPITCDFADERFQRCVSLAAKRTETLVSR
jgi:hypothetical protein